MTTKARHDLTGEDMALLTAVRTREVLCSFIQRGPMTVSQLQECLDWPSKSLYYQVKKLLRGGLLREQGTTLVHGKEAVVYEPIALDYGWPDGFQGLEYERLTARWAKRSLANAARRFERAAESSAKEPSLIDDQFFISLTLRLDEARRRRLKKKLNDVLQEFKGDGPGRKVVLTLAISPDVDRE